MSLRSRLRVLSAGQAWRRTSLKSAGRTLVSALDSDDEDVRTMAGMMLVQAGERSVPLIEEAIAAGHDSDLHRQVLEDIGGDDDAAQQLDELAESDSPKVAEAARRARELLARDGRSD